ncbi:histidine triad (HIT) protein [Sulfuricella denitrificans skB26]|uniref:Histidine triad (HIT) protein n=1 Tax=Sulfuricella denitrificans (strain DSM 22764 / NBRC 105220 / skB26) TaxID=1163617 RepID=S6AK08_SULDS|nr:HIT family protein [Sulfuricella denitrificans]BAN34919.1 histidine triad (HIT) protein [Sulfuricella denitrificans skB26]
MGCPFCKPEEVVLSSELAYVKVDKFPVSPGHLLIVPKRHEANYFDLSQEEQHAIISLIGEAKTYLEHLRKPDGYNIGINIGTPAGQTVMHAHCHLIPRYFGDLEDPRGGVRGVILDKRIY